MEAGSMPQVGRTGLPQLLLWRSLVLLAVICLVLVAGFRGETRDTDIYRFVFEQTRSLPLDPVGFYANYSMEVSFGIISAIVHAMGGTATGVFLVYSALTFVFLALAAREARIPFAAILPFYLGTFFLLQQLMQIRQGLAVAVAFFFLLRFANRPPNLIRLSLALLVNASLHLVSIIPLLVAQGSRILPIYGSRQQYYLMLLLIFITAVAVAQIVSGLQLVGLFERLAQYGDDPDYGASRGLFEVANIRAAILCAAFLWAVDRGPRTSSHVYRLLVLLYVVHFAIRIGFIEFAIISGRLSTSLSFAEVFILPLLVQDVFARRMERIIVYVTYFLVHAYATLFIQADYLISDYFRSF